MKSYEIIYSEDFWNDIKDVLYKYDTVSPKLGDRFLDKIWFAEAGYFLIPQRSVKLQNPVSGDVYLKIFPIKYFIE